MTFWELPLLPQINTQKGLVDIERMFSSKPLRGTGIGKVYRGSIYIQQTKNDGGKCGTYN